MLTGIVREQIKNILSFVAENDLKCIELGIVPGNSNTSSQEARIEAIVSCAAQPSDVLLQRRMRKSILRRKLCAERIPVTRTESKSVYVRKLLGMWQVQNDAFLWKFLKQEDIDAEINTFAEKMWKSLRELSLRVRARALSSKELVHLKKSMDKFLRTVDSIGNAESLLLSQEATPRNPLSDEDSDASSSSSSSASVAKVTKHSPEDETTYQTPSRSDTREHSSPKEHIIEISSSEEEASMDSFENSLSQQTPTMNSNFPSSQQQYSVHFCKLAPSKPLSSVHPVESKIPSSQVGSVDTFESDSAGLSASVQKNHNTSPSRHITHPASQSLPSNHIAGTSSQRNLSTKALNKSDLVPDIRDGKRKLYVQPPISKYFAQDLSSKPKN